MAREHTGTVNEEDVGMQLGIVPKGALIESLELLHRQVQGLELDPKNVRWLCHRLTLLRDFVDELWPD